MIETAPVSTRTIVAWGDSLTAGRTAGRNNSYPHHLANLFGGRREVINRGIGAQTATQICDRMIAAPEYYASTVLIWAGTGSLISEPDAVIPRLETMVSALESDHYLVFSTMNTDRPVQWRGTRHHGLVTSLNRRIGDRFGDHYLDIRSILVGCLDPDSATDRLDAEHDVVPSSLRVDRGHLNAEGNRRVAMQVHARLVDWLDTLP